VPAAPRGCAYVCDDELATKPCIDGGSRWRNGIERVTKA